VLLAIGPNFSHFLEVPRTDNLFNRKRSWPRGDGQHGETIVRFLRPGFHSGTLPRLFAKLRRAERRAHRSGAWAKALRLREALHHVEASVRHFAERELLAFLDERKGWTHGPVDVARVEVGSNRIRLKLSCPDLSDNNLEVNFEEQSGWLLAHIAQPGWLSSVVPASGAVLALAMTGWYKKAGVDLIREQIEACFTPTCPPYVLAKEGLVVWPGKGYEAEAVYDFRAKSVFKSRIVAGLPQVDLPILRAEQVLFKDRLVTWHDWVEAWERDPTTIRPWTINLTSNTGC
jgi:hypothetical protein